MTLQNTTLEDRDIALSVAEEDFLIGLVNGFAKKMGIQAVRERLNIGGNIKSIRTETSDYTIVSTDYTVLIDASLNTVDLLLPVAPVHGQIFNVYCMDSTFTCTVKRNGKNMNGAASDKVLTVTESVTLQYDATYGWIF